MSRHTFVLASGQRLEIQPSKINRGSVLFQVVSPGREVIASCEVDAPTAAVVGQAWGLEAAAAEAAAGVVAAQCCEAPRADCMGMMVPSIGDGCRALREDLGALETLYDNRGKYGGPAVPHGKVLPVVDFPQIDSRGAGKFSHAVDAISPELHAEYFDRRASDRHGEKVGA